MQQQRLADKSYWDKTFYHENKKRWFIPISFADVHFTAILKRYLKPNMHIVEIGVAPGIAIIELAQKFKLIPYGFDYNHEGVLCAKKNFKAAGYDPSHVEEADLFDPLFRKKHRNKFDVVYSGGFIEHFTDVKEVIAYHTEFLKPGGTLILTVPNLRGMKWVTPQDALEKHNLDIMRPETLTILLPKDVELEESGYYGGIINIGLVYYSSRVLELLRQGLFVVQRFVVDPFQRALFPTGIVLQNSVTSPYIYIIATKKGRKK